MNIQPSVSAVAWTVCNETYVRGTPPPPLTRHAATYDTAFHSHSSSLITSLMVERQSLRGHLGV